MVCTVGVDWEVGSEERGVERGLGVVEESELLLRGNSVDTAKCKTDESVGGVTDEG
jgi:hypothetical protein